MIEPLENVRHHPLLDPPGRQLCDSPSQARRATQ
jgi:hypothetical protein